MKFLKYMVTIWVKDLLFIVLACYLAICIMTGCGFAIVWAGNETGQLVGAILFCIPFWVIVASMVLGNFLSKYDKFLTNK